MFPLASQNVLDWLLGEWTLSREAPGQATMHGQASLVLIDPAAAAYHEVVSVQLLNQSETLRAEQRYTYRQTDQGLAVYFAEPSPEAGELFHLLRFSAVGSALHARARHVCGNDLYLSEYTLPLDRRIDSFHVRHDVKGPRKSYSLLSAYVRNSTPLRTLP